MAVSYGMLTTSPGCISDAEFPELLSQNHIYFVYIFGVVWEFQNDALWMHFNMPDYPLTSISVFPYCECEKDLVSILEVILVYCIGI